MCTRRAQEAGGVAHVFYKKDFRWWRARTAPSRCPVPPRCLPAREPWIGGPTTPPSGARRPLRRAPGGAALPVWTPCTRPAAVCVRGAVGRLPGTRRAAAQLGHHCGGGQLQLQEPVCACVCGKPAGGLAPIVRGCRIKSTVGVAPRIAGAAPSPCDPHPCLRAVCSAFGAAVCGVACAPWPAQPFAVTIGGRHTEDYACCRVTHL